jgi:hypothetical protein
MQEFDSFPKRSFTTSAPAPRPQLFNEFKMTPNRRKTGAKIFALRQVLTYLFVANTFQIKPFHEGLAIQADVAFCFMPGA